jgi:hypothetical protein
VLCRAGRRRRSTRKGMMARRAWGW